jgi:EAL and modified HD-GYP domain-containing signal transduction protein
MILGSDKSIFGYSVLLDDNPVTRFASRRSVPVSSAMLFDAFDNLDFERILSKRINFIQVDDSFLISPLLEAINRKAVVFEILQKVVVDADFVEFCKTLSQQGYSLCLDLMDEGQVISPFLSFCRFAKIDISGRRWKEIAERVLALKKFGVQLVACPTKTKEDFDNCSSLGIDLLEGNFFSKSAIVTKKTISPSQALLLDLSNSLMRNEEMLVVERHFKANPELTFGLLKLINSSFFQLREKITSIRQAIALLGYDNLYKWVTLMMFSVDYRDSRSNPLFEKALMRGRLMELLAEKSTSDRSVADSAFVTGILSLVEVLFQVSIDEIVDKLNVSKDIQDALLNREGFLGRLLLLCDALDDQEYQEIGEYLTQLKLTARDLWACETKAIIEYDKTSDQQTK